MSTKGEKLIELIALYRMEQVARRWRARRTAWWLWLTDRWTALGAAKRQGRSQARTAYRASLRKQEDAREKRTPQYQADEELRRARDAEQDKRHRLLDLDEQYRVRRWAHGRSRAAAVVIGLSFAVMLGGWASFGFVLAPTGVAGRGNGIALLATAWLCLPAFVGLGGWAWGLRTLREDRVATDRLERRDQVARDYDTAWQRLADAEHATGTRGAAMVIAPRLWSVRDVWGPHYRPSTELLSVPMPHAIDAEAARLAAGIKATVAEYERRARIERHNVVPYPAGSGKSRALPWLTGGSDADRLRGDRERLGTFVVPPEHAGSFSLGK